MSKYITEIGKGNVAVDDMFLVKNYPTTAGSKILTGWKPLFNAEVVDRLQKAGYTIAGKANIGEFCLDVLGETTYYETEKNDLGYLVGSSGELVAKGEVECALSLDFNGLPRRSAFISGISYIKPTYGSVSRYGAIPCACSMETVGISAKSVQKLMNILSIIAGCDEKDGTSLRKEKFVYSAENPKGKKIGVIKELYDMSSANSKSYINSYIDGLKSNGIECEFISVKEVFVARIAHQILMCAETCNNISRYDGVKFGYRTDKYTDIDDLYINTRTEGFSLNTKTVILYGSDVLSKGRYNECYDKALKIRRLIREKATELFAKYDALICPVCSDNCLSVDKENSFKRAYEENIYTAFSSIIGLPCMVTNGIQLIGDTLKENVLFGIAQSMENRER